MKKILSLVVALAMVLSLVACSNNTKNTQLEKYSHSFLDLFDTASTIIAYDESQEAFDEHFNQFHDELERYDHLFDIYNSYEGVNNLYYVNNNAATQPVEVDPAIIELLEYGKEVYELSGGLTNICFGSVLVLWHNEREYASDHSDARLPDMTELESASEHTNIDDLIIDSEASTVYFNDAQMRLDVGAIAKGFAVQKLTDWAKENLWDNAAISIGGNVSTYGYKNNDGETLWTIGIENPDVSVGEYLLKVNITDLTVVTSGDYQRYYMVDGKKYCHIINPETLMPSEYVASVSVICDDSALGDALSTSLFNMSIEDGKKLVESMDGVEAVWVDKDYNQSFSSGFEDYITE